MAFVKLLPLTECRKGGGTFVECNLRELAVFRLENPERVIVIDNACPHAGGNLSGGELTDNIVACRWHHWAFNLDSGVCTHSDRVRVRRYPVEVRDGIVWADLPA
jgi:nitrite reductase/ring-hydroxylating ferredoxin subunit